MPPPEYERPKKPPHDFSWEDTHGDMRNRALDYYSQPRWWIAFKDYCFLGMIVVFIAGVGLIGFLGWFALLLEPVAGLPDTQEVRDMIPQLAVMTTVIAVVIATIAICMTYYRIRKLDNAHEKSMKQMELDHDLQIYMARMEVIDKHNGVITVEQLIEAEMGTLAGDAAERRGKELVAAINNKLKSAN